MINTIAVFVFYCMMAYIALVVLWVLFGMVEAIFIPSSRTYSRSRDRRRNSGNDDFNPTYWDDSSHCNDHDLSDCNVSDTSD